MHTVSIEPAIARRGAVVEVYQAAESVLDAEHLPAVLERGGSYHRSNHCV